MKNGGINMLGDISGLEIFVIVVIIMMIIGAGAITAMIFMKLKKMVHEEEDKTEMLSEEESGLFKKHDHLVDEAEENHYNNELTQ
jgi:uncharacterized protein YpmB